MKNNLIIISAALLAAACSKSDAGSACGPQTYYGLTLTSSVCCFENEEQTKVNVQGTGFVDGDRIRIKTICPFTDDVQKGEKLDLHLHDGLWLFKYDTGVDGNWTHLTKSDGCDIDGDFKPSASAELSEFVVSQATTYVFTASTWSEEVSFVENGGLTANITFNNVFWTDQSIEEHYRSSDVLWAQYIMQTGTPYLYLEFKHVMSALEITVQDSQGVLASGDAVLTVEGLPAIDQQEIVVGDYYASKSKENEDYGYRQKCTCGQDENGKVLGISTIDQSNKTAGHKDFSDISNDAIYNAYKVTDTRWRVIVPPVNISGDVTVWLRCGDKRYSLSLADRNFEQGKLYPIKMVVK